MTQSQQAFRGAILHFTDNPLQHGLAATQYLEDGLLILRDGYVESVGEASQLINQLDDDVTVTDYRGHLMMPGFVDAHIHYPQTDIIGSHGEQLLEWLERYTFPMERRFSDLEYARSVASFFTDELLRNGTTTGLVFSTVHPTSVDAIFEAAASHNMRLMSGKVMMDRNAPDFLCDTAQSSYDDSKILIERWHNNGRAQYAVTPRFAPTSTDEQLKLAGELLKEYPDLYLQTHVAENPNEVSWVAELFPWSRSYLDVYDHFGLLNKRSVYAHGIYLKDSDRQRMAEAGATIAFCPTSNLFLGSGLFDINAAQAHNVQVAMATDVGGGTSFSMLQTLGEAYKVSQLAGQSLDPLQAFYLATLGGARALDLDQKIGNFAAGKEADFVVLDLKSTPLLARRMANTESLEEQLFALMTLADDRSIAATHIMGECRYSNISKGKP